MQACVRNFALFKRSLRYNDEKGKRWSDAREVRERAGSVLSAYVKRSVDSWEECRGRALQERRRCVCTGAEESVDIQVLR